MWMAGICCCYTAQVLREERQHGVGNPPSQCQAPPCRGTTHPISPRPDLREKLRVRLTPSQLPGSSLMMPTLVFQVVQFTSSTLWRRGQGLGGQLSKVEQPSYQDEDMAGRQIARACFMDTRSFPTTPQGPRILNTGFLGLTLLTRQSFLDTSSYSVPSVGSPPS